MKKIISVVLMLALSLTMCISGYAEEVTSEVTTSDKIEYLVSQGIPADLVKNAPTEDIDDMYTTFYGKSVEYLGTETVTMQETLPFTTYGTISSSDLIFGVSRMAVKNDKLAQKTDPIDFLYVYANYEWQKKPLVRWKDGITVNWDPDVFTLQQNSYIGPEDESEPAEVSQGGLGFYANLSNATYGSAKFKLVPTHRPMYIDKDTYSFPYNTNINGNYLHNKNPIGFSVGFSVEIVSVTMEVGGLSDSVGSTITISYK